MTTNQQALSVVDNEQLHAQGAVLEDLDQWDSTIVQLNVALTDAAMARDRMAEAADALNCIEAEVTLTIEGKNEAERKARLVLTLAEHAGHKDVTAQQREARLRLADSERRAEIARQQCRLLREAVRLQVTVED